MKPLRALPPTVDMDYMPGLVVGASRGVVKNDGGGVLDRDVSPARSGELIEFPHGLYDPVRGFFDTIGFGRDAVDASGSSESMQAHDFEPCVLVLGNEGSDYVQIKIARDLHSVSVGGGAVRGEINQFSRASRKRMLDTLCQLRSSAGLPQFITLTYPGEFPHDAETWKVHLDLFGKRLARAYPGSSAIWKLEPQTRGAPHYHLIVYGVPFDRPFMEWVSRSWYEVVGSGDERHLRAGTNVQPARSLQGVKAYASKRYMGKELSPEELQHHAETVAGWNRPGRFWGVLNRAALPVGKRFLVQLPLDGSQDAVEAVRVARKVYQHKTGRKVCRTATSITLYCSADVFIRSLPKIGSVIGGLVVPKVGYLQWSREFL